MNKRKIRDYNRLLWALICSLLYVPHMVLYVMGSKKQMIDSDIVRLKGQITIKLPNWLAVLYFLHNNSYYRTVFYHRLGPVLSLIIGWWRPRNKYFIIPDSTRVGGGHFICSSLLYSSKCKFNW